MAMSESGRRAESGERLSGKLHESKEKSMQQKSSNANGSQPASTNTGQRGSHHATNDERYVVVITNVESDFAKVHQEAVPRYCCLNERHQRGSPHYLSSASANGEGTAAAERRRRLCNYTVNARTETRSVEVAVYGKADGDVSSVFLPFHGKHHNKNGDDGNIGAAAAAAAAAGGGRKGRRGEGREVDRTQTGDAIVGCIGAPLESETFFSTLEDMVMTLRHKPYFTHPPKFLLNIAGREDGEMLLEAKQCKRRRTDEEDDEKDRVGGEEPPVKKPRDKSDDNGTGDSEPQRIHQTTVRQASMVTAIATTSMRIGTRELQEQMNDIAGFVACWPLRPQNFRVVFTTKMALFKAKKLLDQFEVDGHMRVLLTLSDAMGRDFNDHIASEENAA